MKYIPILRMTVLCVLIVLITSVPAHPQIVFPGVERMRTHSPSLRFPSLPRVTVRSVSATKRNGGDSINFPTENASSNSVTRPNYNSECSLENGLIVYNGECSRILYDLPCKPNQWLVLNKQGLPQCVPRPCPQEELLYNGVCVKISDDSVCGESEILYVEYTGQVYCDCITNFIYDVSLKTCIAEHRQGSCPTGMVLKLNENKVTCVKNNCPQETEIYNPNDMQCYNKTFEGACSEEAFTLIFDKVKQSATCASTATRNILEVPALSSCPAGSKRDILDRCQKVFEFRSDNPSCCRVPSAQISRYSCPANYRRLPNGVCKKTSNIFSS